MKTKNIFWKILAGIALAVLAVFAYFFLTSKVLTITDYTIEAPVASPIRIVHLTDLHNEEFGSGNRKLTAKVEALAPDMIVMTGDMLNREDENTQIICDLISALSEIAPVYFGYGNHEYSWEETWGQSLRDILGEAGAVVLDNDYLDLEVNGTAIRLGGYMGYYWQPHMMTKDPEQQTMERGFYGAFQDTDRYKILLNHIPTQWLDWEYIDKCPVDLVFCGHYHGGVIRIPIIDQGLFAPYVGWFPPYTKGVFVGTEATCVLSTGLGSEYWIPRLNNPPEIVVAEIVPE